VFISFRFHIDVGLGPYQRTHIMLDACSVHVATTMAASQTL
jgi:hypothetical protein